MIKLLKMTIRNFKGIKEFTFEPNGHSVNVSGDNGTGKTSLYDAFLWALFGKDSTNKAEFDWKPLDANNQAINHLETSVEVALLIDGQEKTLKRTVTEKWTNKRNSIHKSFDGHTTVYQIDGINTKQKDYKAYLDELIGEETFRMLTNITFFPEKLDWKKRRQILIDMVGDISDTDVIESNKELKPLSDVIDGKSIDDLMKLTKQRMKEINKQINALPGRIDEVDRSLPDISKLNQADLEAEKHHIVGDIEDLRQEITRIKNGVEKAKLEQDKKELELHYRELEREYIEEQGKLTEHLYEENRELNNQLIEAKTELHGLESKERRITEKIEQHKREIERLNSDNINLRTYFSEVVARQMESFDEHRTTCPTCGQAFQPEKIAEIQAAYQTEVETFNDKKAQELEEINHKGQANNERIVELNQEISDLEKESQELSKVEAEKRIETINARLKEVADSIVNIEQNATPFKETEAAQEVITKANRLNKLIDKAGNDVSSEVTRINDKISEFQASLNAINDDLYQFTLHAQQSKRKQELIAEEQTLSEEFGKLEQQQFLLEEFVRTKVNLLTDSINDKFKLVKFKLFDTNINGGLEEVCEPTVNGANYSTGLNNAARINAGLDIINTLMAEKGLAVPIFIDNAEGVNEFIDIDTQLITLSVTKHKTLRVEEI